MDDALNRAKHAASAAVAGANDTRENARRALQSADLAWQGVLDAMRRAGIGLVASPTEGE